MFRISKKISVQRYLKSGYGCRIGGEIFFSVSGRRARFHTLRAMGVVTGRFFYKFLLKNGFAESFPNRGKKVIFAA